jgi:6-pyruvoyltetrahydropterin/6-carboxytetrahydropterin synthase
MLITKQIGIDMGHRVPNHKSKCRNLHGHRYTIEVGVDDKVITEKGASNEGMVIDFGDLKEVMMKEIESKYDHKCVLYSVDYDFLNEKILENSGADFGLVGVSFIPTAENLAKHWYETIKLELQSRNIKIKYVKVWETPTSTAIYEESNSN